MKKTTGAFLVLLAVLAVPALASAQNITGQVVGTVSDVTTGKPLADARVAVTSPSGSWIEQWVTTDGNGNFTITALPPGHYQLSVQAQGYAATTQQDLQVMVDYRIRANQRLAPQNASTAAPSGAVARAEPR
jgi:uncharacterized surface anchored protein